ncbi:MAG: hypothetical protein IPO64_13705 [Bacteroidetes bacterium]|nr:hypothetical protein [Bacteroidota bacterium]
MPEKKKKDHPARDMQDTFLCKPILTLFFTDFLATSKVSVQVSKNNGNQKPPILQSYLLEGLS